MREATYGLSSLSDKTSKSKNLPMLLQRLHLVLSY